MTTKKDDKLAMKLFADCYTAYQRGDYETTVQLWERVMALGQKGFKTPMPEQARSRFLWGIEQFTRLSPEHRQRMLSALEGSKIN